VNIKNVKIGARLGLAFAAVLTLTMLLTVVGAMRLQQVVVASADMDVALQKLRLADRWLSSSRINRAMSETRLRAVDAADLAAVKAKMKTNSADISKIKEALDQAIVAPEGRALLATIAEQRQVYSKVRDQVFALKEGGAADMAQVNRLIDEKMNPALEGYDASVGKLAEHQKNIFDAARSHVDAVASTGRVLLIAFGAVALLLGGALAWWLTRTITAPLRQAVVIANAVAQGDLSVHVQVDSKDETGELMAALQIMTTRLNELVTRVRSGSDSIASVAAEVAAGNQDLSSRTEQQAGSLEESASSLEQLTSTVRQNADNAQQGNQVAATASSIATRGGAVVSEVVQTMGAINDSARRIVDIIAVIDGIAFQTNILALNAAVEAARAGEQGRGFAVVAGEVRTLAQRSAAAAKEIKSLIDDSVEKVDAGTRLVDEAGNTMKEVVASVKRVTEIMADISEASREQSLGINNVYGAITQMDQVTQQNAALVEEAARATESMQEQAGSLADAVSVFKLVGAAPRVAAARTMARAAPAPVSQQRRLAAVAPMVRPAPSARRVAPVPTPASASADEWETF
jgi:methyl-accepting chemotaxis protein